MSTTPAHSRPLSGFGPNEWIVEDMYQRYLADPASVDSAWHDFFADYRPGAAKQQAAAPRGTDTGAAPTTRPAGPAPAPEPLDDRDRAMAGDFAQSQG